MRRILEETLTYRNPNQNNATLWRIFRQILVRQPIGSKDSIQEEKEGWRRFFLAAQNFELFSNIQDQNHKIKNL